MCKLFVCIIKILGFVFLLKIIVDFDVSVLFPDLVKFFLRKHFENHFVKMRKFLFSLSKTKDFQILPNFGTKPKYSLFETWKGQVRYNSNCYKGTKQIVLYIKQCILHNWQGWIYAIGTNRITTGLVWFVPEYWQTFLLYCTRIILNVNKNFESLVILCLERSVPKNGGSSFYWIYKLKFSMMLQRD